MPGWGRGGAERWPRKAPVRRTVARPRRPHGQRHLSKMHEACAGERERDDVRLARRAPNNRDRTRDGRLQVEIEVATFPAGREWSRPQWADAALVFVDRDEALDLYRRARNHAKVIGSTIWAAAIDLTLGGAGFSS